MNYAKFEWKRRQHLHFMDLVWTTMNCEIYILLHYPLYFNYYFDHQA